MMESAQEFAFKSAPLGGRVRFRVRPTRIEKLDPDGRIRAEVNLTKVRSARWAEAYANRLTVRALVLKTGQSSFRIEQTIKGLGEDHPESPVYLAAASAALSALASAQPDFVVAVGQPPALRWLYAALSVAVAAVLTWCTTLILNRHDAAESWWVVLALGSLAAGALYMAWRLAPWTPLPTKRPGELAAVLAPPHS